MHNLNTVRDPLDYMEDSHQAEEYLRLTLSTLSRLQLSPNPINYTLCYEYVSGRNQALRVALEKFLSTQTRLEKETAITLYRDYIWDEDRKALEDQSVGLHRLMAETLTGVEESANKASESSERFVLNSKRIDASKDILEIRQVVSEVVAETHSMAKNSLVLKDMLLETKREVGNLRKELQRSQKQAKTDGLTGLLNNREFHREIAKNILSVKETGESLSLLLIDIDNFKSINDEYGHLVGDKLLRFISAQFTNNVKGQDIIARTGGEEFAILLPNTGLDQARMLAEIIRTRIAKSRFRRTGDAESIEAVTLSVGVTSYKSNEELDEFVSRADQALHQSKQRGKNRVSILF